MTQESINNAEAAHIYSFSARGPRGNEGVAADQLNGIENLLLTCRACHKTIDDDQRTGVRCSPTLLQSWKARHEERVERVTGIDPDHHSHVILYNRAIGGIHSPVRFDRAAVALFPRHYPAESRAITLANTGSDLAERDAEFWATEQKDLERKFDRMVQDRLARNEIEHLSIFALAPMPLLIRLGTLLTDIRDVEVFQYHRKPKGWSWPEESRSIEIQLQTPESKKGPPALVVALSATITDDRIERVLGEDTSIWRLTIPEPTQECIRSRADLAEFYLTTLKLMDEIKAAHGHNEVLSIFPAAPVSAMVELGRARQPKADMPWRIYDEVRNRGGFVEAICVGDI